MIENFSEREKVIFDFLNLLPKDSKYVVIGGYAVSSFGFPRFSVDLDIVIPDIEASFFQKLISDNSFVLSKEKEDLAYSGKFERYEKGFVSIDLLINAVQSRQTSYSYQFSYVFDNSEFKKVSGWDLNNIARVRVAKKEMLIALKIHSMRTADKRDIIMLCYEKPDVKGLTDHLLNSPREKIISNIEELVTILKDNNFKDSFKGVFSVDDKIFDRSINNCQLILEEIKNNLI